MSVLVINIDNRGTEMNREDFIEIGEICHGKRWQAATAKEIGYTSRHIQKIVSGETPVGPKVRDAAIKMLGKRKDLFIRIYNKHCG